MAFKRSFLESLGLNDSQVQAVMDEHVSVVEALKADRDKYKVEADKLPDIQKELENLKGGEDWKKKYEDEHTTFENYKKDLTEKEKAEKVKAAYRKLLTEEKISEKRLDAILKVTDFSGMKLDKDGKLENLDSLKENIGKEWGEFKVTEYQRKQQVATPPVKDNAGGGEGRARELYLKHAKQQGIKIEDAGKE